MVAMSKTEARPSRKAGFALAVLVVAAVMGFIAVEAAIGLATGYAGLLFFWFWAVVGKAEFRELPACLIGALGGTATAWLLQRFSLDHNMIGIVLILGFIVVAVIIQAMDLLPIAFNPAFMLFLTVFAAPLLQMRENFGRLFESILLACLYFGGIVLAVGLLQKRASRRGDHHHPLD